MISDEFLFVVSRDFPLDKNYRPAICCVENGYRLEKTASFYAKKMLRWARQEGIAVEISSAYRSPQYQQKLIDKDIEMYIKKGMSREDATKETLRFLALPYTSEHNAGLALDLTDFYENELTEDFNKTETYMWLCENAHLFGFIERYQKGKESITGIAYEPWHYRFVGLLHAEKIMKSGITLEEYIEKRR